jgi:hypothetical protein
MADHVRIYVEGEEYTVAGGSFREMVAAIKGIEGRRFDGPSKMWILPVSLEVVREMLEAKGYEVHSEGDSQRSALEDANAAQMFIRANEEAIREMLGSLRADYERYSFRSRSSVKQQIGRRMAMFQHALEYAGRDLAQLDQQAIATLVKAGHVVRGEISNPSWATPGREQPK